MNKSAASVLVLALCAFYSFIPLLTRYEFFKGGSDLSVYINYVYQVNKGFGEGIIYPRWFSISNDGYGSPTMIFYAPLFFWTTGFLNTFIPSLVLSVKITTFLGFLMSGIFMYIFLRNFCSHTGSLAGGIAYQLMPYHIFDFYCRQALAETFAFFWLPLILHFAYKGATEGRIRDWIGFSLSYAGLILTHIISAYLFTFVVAFYTISLSVRERSLRVLPKFLGALFLGLSISAVYFIPMFFERRFVRLEFLVSEGPWGTYLNNFLYLADKKLDPFYINLEQIVMLQAIPSAVPLLLCYYGSRKYRDVPNFHLFAFFSSVFAFSIFMSTSYSNAIWEVVPGMPTIQFPWRWLMASTFAVSVLIGLTFDAFPFAYIKRDSLVRLSMVAFHAVVIASLYLSSLYILTTEMIQGTDLTRMITDGNKAVEFRPVWLTDWKKDFSRENWVPVIFKEGKGRVDVVSWKTQSRVFKVDTTLPSILRVSTFYYPGWTAVINNKEIPIGIEKDSGAMLLSIPPGKNEVLLEFRDTPLRRTAKWISIISLFAALTGLIATRVNRQVIVT